MDIRDYGDRALLVECGCADEVLGLAASLRAAGLPGVTDIVPGARTVLVTFGSVDARTAARPRVRDIGASAPESPPATQPVETITIDVVYDGADLAEVAELLGMRPADVVEAHTGTAWRVGFSGFAPGFAYLIDGDPRLNVPRRSEPRTRVPAGSVALAGDFSGIYPRESPGGWQLIGRTEAVLWDVNRPAPALLTPGMRVRFRAVDIP